MSFGYSVHRGSNAWCGERDVAGETGRQGNGVGREVDVVREEDDIVVGVRVALVKQL